MRHTLLLIFISVCALQSGAQTLTKTYIEYADSADNYIAAGRWADAERSIISALRTEPANKSNYLLWANLGMVRTNQGNIAGALEAYDIGLVSAPRSSVLLAHRGRTLLSEGHIDEAERDLKLLAEINPTHPTACEGLGDIATYRHEESEAIDLYEKAVEYDMSPNPHLYFKLVFILLEKDTESEAEATRAQQRADALLSDALGRYPDDANLTLLRALLCKQRYLNSESESYLKRALQLGADPSIVNALGL